MAQKQEGDGASPIGNWRLVGICWRADRIARPQVHLPRPMIGPRSGWSDDPRDPAYNRPIRHPHPFGAERMARGDGLYDLVGLTDFNTDPVVAGAGSAIFVHVWRKPRHPTAGCIAFARSDLMWILARWTPYSRLRIRPLGGLC